MINQPDSYKNEFNTFGSTMNSVTIDQEPIHNINRTISLVNGLCNNINRLYNSIYVCFQNIYNKATPSGICILFLLTTTIGTTWSTFYFAYQNHTVALQTYQDRAEVLNALKEASMPDQVQQSLKQETYMEEYQVDPDNYRLYQSGHHRRPTDPATPWEVEATLNYLFSEDGTIDSIEEAQHFNQVWEPYNNQAPLVDRIYPHYISNNIDISGNDTNNNNNANPVDRFYTTYDEYRQTHNATTAIILTHEAIHADEEWFYSFNWGNTISTTTHVACKDTVIAVEHAIEQSIDYHFRRYMAVKARGAIVSIDDNGVVWASENIIVVDITELNQPFINGTLSEHYRVRLNNRFDDTPATSPMSPLDNAYLIAAARALYGGQAPNSISPVRWIPYYNGNPYNINGGISTWSRNLRVFAKPFEWLDGTDAIMYGGQADPDTGIQKERIMVAGLLQGDNAAVPVDAHALTGGVLKNSPPLQMIFTARQDRVDPNHRLPGSRMIALTWHGRGLVFSPMEAQQFNDALSWNSQQCKQFRQVNVDMDGKSHDVLTATTYDTYGPMPSTCMNINDETTQFTRLTEILSQAIHRAWGDESRQGVYPGRLARRSDGIMVPELTLTEPYDGSTFANHATPSVIADMLQGLNLPTTRDIRNNNQPYQTPLVNDQGEPQLAPNGKHMEYLGLDGPSFTVDGYAVTWDVGLKWKFLIGFADEAGLTIYNIRLQLPPTQQYPMGEEVPYLFRASIPNFGSSYANTNTGGLHSALFQESHYGEHVGLVPGENCRGLYVTLPIFRVRGITDATPHMKPIHYSQYGVDGAYPDPYAEALLGIELPYNEFPLERRSVQNGIASHGVCIQETDEGHAMWHLYTAQRLRSLAVFGATISDAYNVVNRFEFLSDGKMKVAERLHGKPAIMGHGLGGPGGAMGSGGRGGFAPNHLHWHVVALEPFIRQNRPNVINKVRVSDLAPMDDVENWFGLSMNRYHEDINFTNETAKMKYRFDTQRVWLIDAIDTSTATPTELGGLMIKSQAWGPTPAIHDGLHQWPLRYNDENVTIPPEHTWQNNWWLSRNVWVRNADRTRATNALLSRSLTPDCHITYDVHDCQPDEPLQDNPVVYAVMKVYHSVINEEMPVQNCFTDVEIDIWPHNLLGFNPNILVRYMPQYNQYVQNPYVRGPNSDPIYTPPYSSEWSEP